MCVSIQQQKRGLHLLVPALHGVDLEFPSALVDCRGVIPASSLQVGDGGTSPVLGAYPGPPYEGYIKYDEKQGQVDLRLYGRKVDVHGHPYFPEHPLNGVHRVNQLKVEK